MSERVDGLKPDPQKERRVCGSGFSPTLQPVLEPVTLDV